MERLGNDVRPQSITKSMNVNNEFKLQRIVCTRFGNVHWSIGWLKDELNCNKNHEYL